MARYSGSPLLQNSTNADTLSVDETSANEAHTGYMQDDIFRGLRASLVEVLSCTLADQAHPDFVKGVLSLARRQADLYGIPWHDLMQSLCAMPELRGLISQLQVCSIQRTSPYPTR